MAVLEARNLSQCCRFVYHIFQLINSGLSANVINEDRTFTPLAYRFYENPVSNSFSSLRNRFRSSWSGNSIRYQPISTRSTWASMWSHIPSINQWARWLEASSSSCFRSLLYSQSCSFCCFIESSVHTLSISSVLLSSTLSTLSFIFPH
ncbi:hypothetical protein [Crucivirus-429]|nr:hypothetical protein [Crucivirus-429]